jgi:hypothetical protein
MEKRVAAVRLSLMLQATSLLDDVRKKESRDDGDDDGESIRVKAWRETVENGSTSCREHAPR